MKKKLLGLSKIILAILALFGVSSIVLLALGYRPIIASNATPDWGAISTTVNIIVPIGIAIIGLFISNNRKDTPNSQVYDKQYELYLEIKDYIDSYINDNFSPMAAMRNLVESVPENIFSDIRTKSDLVFSENVNVKLARLNDNAYEIINLTRQTELFSDYLISRNTLGGDFKEVFEGFYNKKNKKYDESMLKSVSDNCQMYNIKLESEEPRDYNFFTMYQQRKDMIIKFNEIYDELLKCMKDEMG